MENLVTYSSWDVSDCPEITGSGGTNCRCDVAFSEAKDFKKVKRNNIKELYKFLGFANVREVFRVGDKIRIILGYDDNIRHVDVHENDILIRNTDDVLSKFDFSNFNPLYHSKTC
jgi:hypothetical protein